MRASTLRLCPVGVSSNLDRPTVGPERVAADARQPARLPIDWQECAGCEADQEAPTEPGSVFASLAARRALGPKLSSLSSANMRRLERHVRARTTKTDSHHVGVRDRVFSGQIQAGLPLFGLARPLARSYKIDWPSPGSLPARSKRHPLGRMARRLGLLGDNGPPPPPLHLAGRPKFCKRPSSKVGRRRDLNEAGQLGAKSQYGLKVCAN